MKPVNLALVIVCSVPCLSDLFSQEENEENNMKQVLERLEALQQEVNKLKQQGSNGQFDHLAEPLGKIVRLEFKMSDDPGDEGLRITCATQTYRANFHRRGEQEHLAITIWGRLKLSEDTTKVLLTYEIQFSKGNRQGNQSFDVAGSHLVPIGGKATLVKLEDDFVQVTVSNAEKEL
jgi:hypothetical protein